LTFWRICVLRKNNCFFCFFVLRTVKRGIIWAAQHRHFKASDRHCWAIRTGIFQRPFQWCHQTVFILTLRFWGYHFLHGVFSIKNLWQRNKQKTRPCGFFKKINGFFSKNIGVWTDRLVVFHFFLSILACVVPTPWWHSPNSTKKTVVWKYVFEPHWKYPTPERGESLPLVFDRSNLIFRQMDEHVCLYLYKQTTSFSEKHVIFYEKHVIFLWKTTCFFWGKINFYDKRNKPMVSAIQTLRSFACSVWVLFSDFGCFINARTKAATTTQNIRDKHDRIFVA